MSEISTIALIFQKSQYNIIAILSYLQKYFISINICIIGNVVCYPLNPSKILRQTNCKNLEF